MDRQMIADHLAQAERHVTLGEKNIERQKAIIAELEIDGHDTARARKTLQQFLELQVLHMEDRERLAQALVDWDNFQK